MLIYITYTLTCIYVCIYVYTHIHACIRVYIHIHVYVYTSLISASMCPGTVLDPICRQSL